MGDRLRVRLVLDLECDRWSLLALRLMLRRPRLALQLRHQLAGVLEQLAGEVTQGAPGVWRFVVRSGRLEAGEAKDTEAGGEVASAASEPPERSEGGADALGDQLEDA